MKVTKIVKLGAASIGILALAACAQKQAGTGGANKFAAGNSAAYSSGVGKQANFNGNDQSRLQAPHHETFYFDFDRIKVHGNDLASVRTQAKYLASHPRATIILEGNTDERGSREYNVGLGERRAKSIEEILKLAGVKRNQIRIVSYGQERPVALGHSESAWRLNRRVELSYENKA